MGYVEMKYIEVRNLTKEFVVDKQKVKIIEEINFDIGKGEFICIIGSSGCGKTTLLRIMSGFEKTTDGEIICDGEKVKSPKTKWAFIFQDFNQLFPWKTVKQNIRYPLSLNKKISRKERNVKVNELLQMIGLKSFANYYPHKLSGGMKQRVVIARALAMNSNILFMDEPFSALDPQTRDKLHKELLKIWKEINLTIIFVTHNISEAIRLADKIIVLGGIPARIIKIVKNDVQGNRTPTDTGYLELWDKLHKAINLEE